MGFCAFLCPCLSFGESKGEGSLRGTQVFIAHSDGAGQVGYLNVTGRKGASSATPQGKCLVFVHGFNTKGCNAVKTAKSIGSKLGGQWSVVVYIWSNKTAWPGLVALMRLYLNEEKKIPEASDKLRYVLADLNGKCEVNVLAHSMGTRIAIRALRGTAIRKLLLAAADVGSSDFGEALDHIQRTRLTAYGSSRDMALWASYILHKSEGHRVGQCITGGAWEREIEWIDCTGLFKVRDYNGHGYFSSTERVKNDIAEILSGMMELRLGKHPLHGFEFAAVLENLENEHKKSLSEVEKAASKLSS